MTTSLFPASEIAEFTGIYWLDTPPRQDTSKAPDQPVPVAVGEAFFMPEEEEYFSFEI